MDSDQRSTSAAICNLGTTVSPRLQMTSLTIRVTQFIGDTHRGSTGPAEPLLRTTAITNMAAANFVVITNGEGCVLTGTADIDQ